MDKNSIKKFAVWARRELITRVSQRAVQYEITEKGYGEYDADSVNGRVMSASEKSQRKALIDQIRAKGYEQVMEEVAYTWFNRFSALRFMEVNGYLPSRIRVFTDDNNNFKPQIITDAIDLTIDGLDMEKVYELKDDARKEEELYKYLLITQCNALSKVLPGMFQKISDYTELLFPDNLLREGSVVQQMIEMIPEDDWKDAVQIIRWLYQYYNTEKKDEVFAALKKNVKITKDNIPAATQLFTPDWIVRYMVENSLGRLWVEGHPNDDLKSKWDYYLEEAEQEESVQTQLAEIRKEYANLKPEDIRVIDPCSGSGHILAYLFDVLMQIYDSYGYTTREAVDSIVTNNIYGLDIDERAAQLAYFAVMMKARQYDSRFLKRTNDEGNPAVPQPHVFAIEESNNIDSFTIEYFCNGNPLITENIDILIKTMKDAKEFGSLVEIEGLDFNILYKRIDEIKNDSNLSREAVLKFIVPVINVAFVLSKKYNVVVTNPPYMGNRGMSAKLNAFVQTKYKNTKSDLFAVFIEKCRTYTIKNGYYGMITPPSFLFLTAFEELRKGIITGQTITNLIHMGRGIFGIDFGSTSFVLQNTHIANFVGRYMKPHQRTFQYIDPDDIAQIYLNAKENEEYTFDFASYNSEIDDDSENEETLMSENLKIAYRISQDAFMKIPGTPVAYWLSDAFINAFQSKKLGECADVITGMTTGNNNEFLRLWYEVDINKEAIGYQKMDQIDFSKRKWIPYSKGGNRRNFYGNGEYVVNWSRKDEFNRSKTTLQHLYLRKGLTWPFISSGKFSARYLPQGYLWDVAGSPCFFDSDDLMFYTLGFLCSKVADLALKIMNPTINVQAIDLAKLPLIENKNVESEVIKIVRESIEISTIDWDSNETSWDFKSNPICKYNNSGLMQEAISEWDNECKSRFSKIKENEERLNELFITVYGLKGEVLPEISDEDVTVQKVDTLDCIKKFIFYAVGCMFGRYSLDEPGLAYAGGEWDDSKYSSFIADRDNIIPICDDEYFEDDIVGRFVKFVEVVYGKDTLQENLKFIADTLGGKGQPIEVIRNYFLNGFYADHCKMYQKRPIYWLFDSGKKNGFKCLIYMHRYQPDTIARIRTDYVHEQQSRYRTAVADIEQRLMGASGSEKVKLDKQKATLLAQITEIGEYEEKIHHLADQMIRIDLDDGVKKNYEIFKDVLAKIK